MSTALPLILAVIALLSLSASAQEVAYAYGDLGGRPLESGNITPYNGTDLVTTSIASGRYNGGSALQGSGITVEEIKREIDKKLNVGNPRVRDEGRSLILEYPGDGTINQICSIYDHMVANWSYARDTRGIEEFQYSNQSLEYGKGRYSGQGDCDDFAILMASLIESIGGTSRIILAYGPDGGHAYAEVYLGKAGGPESDVQRMISWLRKNYKVNEIYVHPDLKTSDVWLNLDWWREPSGSKHPGGPFFRATSQTPIPIRENTSLAPLMPLNDQPIAQFTISPSPPVVGENASFDASRSKDIGGRIVAYSWDFGDGNKTGKMSDPIAEHTFLKGGPCTVILTVEDDEGATNISSQEIAINNPPWANFTIVPQKPLVGDRVKFDASNSYDEEDDKHLDYHWEINNNSAIFSVASLPKQIYDEKGLYWINLTVTDKDGAEGHKNILLKINQPPTPWIAFDSANLSLGKIISFDAGTSEDLDGQIVSYAWDFGDSSAADYNKTALHSYSDGGKKTVRLSVMDNDGAIASISQEISINRPPVSSFSIDPIEPKKGDLVIFDASESSDSDGKIGRYMWDFGVGKAEPEVYYSNIAEHTYSRPGTYSITLTVEDDRGATGSFSQSVEIEEINNKPIVISLQPDKQSPLEIGTIVTWTAVASDKDNDSLQFQFYLDGLIIRDWSETAEWSLTLTKEQIGTHFIDVKVRDGKHSMEGDSAFSSNFEVYSPPDKEQIEQSSIALKSNMPQLKENKITNIEFSPPTPSNLIFGEPIKVSFNYEKNKTDYVMIYANFIVGGRFVGLPFDYITYGSPRYADAMGSGASELSIDSNKIITVDGVNLQMIDKNETVLCEVVMPAQFHYGPTNISNELQLICSRGNREFMLNNYGEAIKYFDQAIQIDRRYKFAWKDRGDAFFALSDYKKAIESYDEALSIEPRFAEAWSAKGDTLILLGKYEDAVKCFDEAINCYYYSSLYNDGNVDGAREGKSKALNAESRNFVTYTELEMEQGSELENELITLYSRDLPDDILSINNKCSYNFFSIPGQPAKTYGDESYGDFYFLNNKFFANNAGMRGLVDLGLIEFDSIKIPVEGFDRYGIDAIIGHVYVSPARWCASWVEGKYSISECGQEGKYIIFRVKNIYNELDADTVDIEYILM